MRIILLALGMLSMAPQSVAAQAEAGVAQSADAHAELHAAMRSGDDLDAMMDNYVASSARELATANPRLARLEADFPGLAREVAEAMRPVLAARSRRVRLEYAPKVIGLLRQTLTADEALELTRFYRSELGQTLLRESSKQADETSVIAESLAQREVSAEAVRADAERSDLLAQRVMSEEQRRELDAAIAANPALMKKLEEYISRRQALEAEMNNAPLTAEEEEELTRVIRAARSARLTRG